jgi:17 kDa outer membrane surface antigen
MSSRLTRYRATPASRLWRGAGRTAAPAVLVLALAGGGCSYQLGSMFDKRKDERKLDASRAEMTGSITPRPVPVPRTARLAGEAPPDADLVFAREAVADALSQDGKSASTPWENPNTGARGTITPLAAAYTVDGLTCRDFLASYVRDKTESWLQGEACRIHQGRWEVRSMKPWRRT